MTSTTTPAAGRAAQRPAAGTGGRAARTLRTQIGVLVLVQLVGMMSGTIIATALPAITREVDGTTLHYTWMFVTTALASTVTTPLWGRLGDVRDARTVLQWSIGVYTLGALLCGLAPTADLLIAARVVQGIGIGGHIALTQALAARLVVARDRARVNGFMGVSQVVATVTGPLVGALLVQVPHIGWRLCFLLGVPVALVAAVIVHRVMPRALPVAAGRVDVVGGALLVLGLTGLLGWVSLVGQHLPGRSPASLALVVGSVVVLGVAAWWEWRSPHPIVPLRTLRSRVPLLAALASLTVGVSMFGGTVFVTQYLQLGRGLSALVAGAALMPMALATFAAALLVGHRSARTGRLRRYLLLGTGLVAGGNGLLVVLTPSTPLWVVLVATCAIGAGLGASATNLVLAAQNATALRDVGAVSGAVVFCRTAGSAVGLTVLGSVVAAYVPSAAGVPAAALPGLYAHASSVVFACAAGTALLGVVAVAAMPRIALRTTFDLEPPPRVEG